MVISTGRPLASSAFDEKSPYAGNLCPFYLGVADGDFATAQDHSAQCWRALQEVSEAKWLPSDGDRPDWVSKGDRSKEDSNEKKMGVRMSDSP
jgi:hypothetical protein